MNPKRGTPTYALLTAIAESPDEIGPAEAADIICPRPRLTGTEGYREWVRSVAVARETPNGRVLALDPARQAQASRALRRLAEAGLIAPLGGPRLSDWFEARAALRGIPGALALSTLGEGVDVGPVAVDIVERVRGGIATVEEALRPAPVEGKARAEKPSGATQAVWRELVRLRIVVGVYGRRVTEKGMAVVGGGR